MAGIQSLGGVVIPITVVRTGDKMALKNLEKELGQISNAVVQVNSKTKEVSSQWATSSKFVNALNKELNAVRWTMVNVGFALTAIGGLAAPFVLAAKAAAEYEQELAKINATTGAAPQQISNTILSARQGRPFDRIETSTAYLEIAKAGYTANESAKMLTSTLDLAQISFMKTDVAAQSLTQILSQFSLGVDETSHVVDLLSTVADSSRASVEGLTSSLSYVGPLAEASGQKIDNMVVILGLLADAGLDNTKAGTTLRQVLSSLEDPSVKATERMHELGISFFTSSGQVKQLTDFIPELANALNKLPKSEQQKILADLFEVRALTGVSALLNDVSIANGGLEASMIRANVAGSSLSKTLIQEQTTLSQTKSFVEDLKDSFLGLGDAINASIVVPSISILDEMFNPKKAQYVDVAKSFEDRLKAAQKSAALFQNAKFNFGDNLLGSALKNPSVIEDITKSNPELGKQAGDLVKEYQGVTASIERWANIAKQARDDNNAATQAEDYAKAAQAANLLAVAEESRTKLLIRQYYIRAELDKMTGVSSALDETSKFQYAASSMDAILQRLSEDSSPIGKGFFEKLLGTDKSHEVSSQLQSVLSLLDNVTSVIDEAGAQVSKFGDDNVYAFQTSAAAIYGYYGAVRNAEAEIINLSAAKDQLQKSIQDTTSQLQKEQRELQTLNDRLKQTEQTISDISGSRFSGETDVLGILKKAEVFRKQQQLSALGVGDANQFIHEALQLQLGDYDQLFAKLSGINSEMERNQSTFEAWQQTIKTAISSEIEAGQNLSTDVTNRVKQWQTALLSTSQFNQGANQNTQFDDFINKLQLAYDVQYGGMHNEVTTFLDQQKDRENGVFDTSSQLITALQSEMVERDKLRAAIQDQTDVVTTWSKTLETKTLKLQEVLDQIANKKDAITAAVTEISKLGPAVANAIANMNGSASGRVSRASGSSTIGYYNTNGSTIGATSGFAEKAAAAGIPGFNDFISRPGQAAVSFSPDDTIIGVKDTSALGGGTSVSIGNITINGYNKDPEELAYEVAQAIARELNAR